MQLNGGAPPWTPVLLLGERRAALHGRSGRLGGAAGTALHLAPRPLPPVPVGGTRRRLAESCAKGRLRRGPWARPPSRPATDMRSSAMGQGAGGSVGKSRDPPCQLLGQARARHGDAGQPGGAPGRTRPAGEPPGPRPPPSPATGLQEDVALVWNRPGSRDSGRRPNSVPCGDREIPGALEPGLFVCHGKGAKGACFLGVAVRGQSCRLTAGSLPGAGPCSVRSHVIRRGDICGNASRGPTFTSQGHVTGPPNRGGSEHL